jgi:hypothetical protein
MPRSFDEEKFFRATGLDLQRLIQRHVGKESESQIFEWIGMVLGREYFTAGGSAYINTLKGWGEYLKDQGWRLKAAEAEGNEDVQSS